MSEVILYVHFQCSFFIGTYEAAENHRGSRRHLLPAIYNSNLQRFHWTPELEANAAVDQVIKQEPIADLIWMDGMEFDLSNENENEVVNEHVVENERVVENENELENQENGPAVVKAEANVVFPNLPKEIIDLTDNDLTRYVIGFNASDLEPNLNEELDAQMEWFGQFPNPIDVKQENNDVIDELGMDPLFGRVPFETVSEFLQNSNKTLNSFEFFFLFISGR